MLAGLGLARRDLAGLLIAGVGRALVHRGATGRCNVYESMGINTQSPSKARSLVQMLEERGVHVSECFLIDKPRAELYAAWRDFERLPRIMSHLKSVRTIDEKRSEWVAATPSLTGGEVRWESEITEDIPDERIAWRTLPGAAVDHRSSVSFTNAPGDRGTHVRIDPEYDPPAGQIGEWLAWLFGKEPKQQIRSDLRKFKRLMETGEIATTTEQTHGSCGGPGYFF